MTTCHDTQIWIEKFIDGMIATVGIVWTHIWIFIQRHIPAPSCQRFIPYPPILCIFTIVFHRTNR